MACFSHKPLCILFNVGSEFFSIINNSITGVYYIKKKWAVVVAKHVLMDALARAQLRILKVILCIVEFDLRPVWKRRDLMPTYF